MAKKTAATKTKKLTYARANGYDKLAPAEFKKLEALCAEYRAFLGAAKLTTRR